MLGTLAVDEQVIPITGVELRGGNVVFVGRVKVSKPLRLADGQEFRIHGSDGTEIAQCRWQIQEQTVQSGGWLNLYFPVHIDTLNYESKEKV